MKQKTKKKHKQKTKKKQRFQKGPIAKKKHHLVAYGAVKGENRGEGTGSLEPFKNPIFREDPWFWLRDDDKKDPEIMRHLKKENAYAEKQTKHLNSLRKKLYKEHLSHLQEDDQQAPSIYKNHFYYTKTQTGNPYKQHYRKPKSTNESIRLPDKKSNELLILDENKIAETHDYCDVGVVLPSPNEDLLAYTVDFNGDEQYELVIINIQSGEKLSETLPKKVYEVEWGNNETIFYTVPENTAMFINQFWVYTLPDNQCKMLYEEKENKFSISLSRSLTERYIFMSTSSPETSEIHTIDMKQPTITMKIFQPRINELLYDIQHDGYNGFYILTNKDDAMNNRFMNCDSKNTNISQWKEVIPYDPDRNINELICFKNFIALIGSEEGLTQLWLLKRNKQGNIQSNTFERMKFKDNVYEVEFGSNYVFETPYLRYGISSLKTPFRLYDLDMRNVNKQHLIKETPVLNYNPNLYECERLFATAVDNTLVPISIVYKKESKKRVRPLHLYGYGSYGMSSEPGFDRNILPYLDRGMIYAIAHVRGGGEMGRQWRYSGKYLQKKNTFSDFISCVEHLIDLGYTKPKMISCEGSSAGGLLIGNVIHMRPDLFSVALADAPFVDLCVTICDPSLDAAVEWEEWGNPNTPKFHDYMLSYSPVDIVRKQRYPHLLIKAGLLDPRVSYWEPAKWASKLRDLQTKDSGIIVAKFDLDRGHGGSSDRYKWIHEQSYNQAFILDKLGLK